MMNARKPIARQSQKFSRQRREHNVRIAIIVAIVVLTWTYSMSKLTRLAVFAIDSITVIGVDDDLRPAIQAAAFKALDGSVLGLFSRSNSFLYPARLIEEAVGGTSPRIASVETETGPDHSLVITVHQKPSAAIVCTDLPEIDNQIGGIEGSNCYTLDNKGSILRSATSRADKSLNVYFAPSIAEASSSQSLEGTNIASENEFAALQSVYDSVRSAGIRPVGILIKEEGGYELYAKSMSGSGTTVVYMSPSRPMSEQTNNLISFWQKKSAEAKVKNATTSFDYIDVRYGSNVFYR